MARVGRLLELAPDIPKQLRADALRVYSGTADLSGNDRLSEQPLLESRAIYEELGDERGIAISEHMLAVYAWRREDWGRVRELTEHSFALAEGRFDFVEIGSYWLLGQLALLDGDVERAIELTQKSADMAKAVGWPWWEAGQRYELLMLALRLGDLQAAEREGMAALEMLPAQENRLWTLYTLAGLAQVALARDDLERAGLLWGAAEKEAESVPRWVEERARRGGALLEEAREPFANGVERGRALDLWDAAAIALGED
jgi:hypothetical protein